MDTRQIVKKLNNLPADKQKEIEDLIDTLTNTVQTTPVRRAGFAKGTFKILPGFNDPIEGLDEYAK